MISVAAIDSSYRRLSFKQYNNEVGISALGIDIVSTYKNTGHYSSFSGMSMASPHVDVVATLVWSHFLTLNAHELRNNGLEATAQDLGLIDRDNDFDHGLVRADLAYDF